MYCNDNFNSWLLILSRTDENYSTLDMYLPSSETEEIWGDKWVLPASFVFAEIM